MRFSFHSGAVLLKGVLASLALAGPVLAQPANQPQLVFDSGPSLNSTTESSWFSVDNRFLALADDHEIRVYDVATGLLLRRLNNERNYYQVRFGADFQRLRYTRRPQAGEPAPGQGHETVRGVFGDSVFFQRPVAAQQNTYCLPVAAGRVLVSDRKRVRLQGRRPADTLSCRADAWRLNPDGSQLLTQYSNTFFLTDVRSLTSREVGLGHVPRRWQSAAERADPHGNGWGSYRAPGFYLSADGRRLYGRLEPYSGSQQVFRVFDVARDSIVFSHEYQPGRTDSEAYNYQPAYYPSCDVVTLPQQTDLVVYNLKTGAETRLPYPAYRFGLESRVTADGGTLIVWNNELVDVYDLRTGRYICRSKSGGTVQVNPQAAIAYIGAPTSASASTDSTIVLRFAPVFSQRRVAGSVIQLSPDGNVIYGKKGFRTGLFDADLRLLRPINTCAPAANIQLTASPTLLLTSESGLCNFTNEQTSRGADFQVWNLRQLERRPVQFRAGRVAKLASLDDLSAFEDDLVYNDLGHLQLLTDTARLAGVCAACGELSAIASRYALFSKVTFPLLDPTTEKDTLTLVADFARRQLALGVDRPLKLATLDAARHEISALNQSWDTGAEAYLTTWDFAGKKLRESPLVLPADYGDHSEKRLELSPTGKFAIITSTAYVSSEKTPPKWFFDLGNGHCLGQAPVGAEQFALSEQHGQLLTLTDSDTDFSTTATIRQLPNWKPVRTFRYNRVCLRGERLLGFWPQAAPGANAYERMFQPAGTSRLTLLNWCTGDTLYRETIRHDRITVGDLSPDGRWLAYATNTYDVCLVSLTSRTVVARLRGHTGSISTLKFTADNARLLSSSDDGTVRVWSVAGQTETGTLIMLDADNYLATTPEGYYRCSKNALSRFGYRLGDRAYTGDQFDLRYNRPDLVLAAFGADTALVRSYRAAWQKRVRRAGFAPESLAGTAPVPTLDILNRAALPFATAQPSVSFELQLADSLVALSRLHVWANGVAVFGKRGRPLTAPAGQPLRLTVRVALTTGPNQLQLAVQNAAGVESYRSTVIINRTSPPAAPGRVYFVGIGAGRFQQRQYNLTYAAKDIRDLARAVRRRFPTAVLDTLTDARVTRENVRALRTRLLATRLEDRVLLSVAGHGLLDKQLAFYYATHDLDFANPAWRGIAYDDLEGLLDSIPARRRLLLLDACHSGEVDPDAARVAAARPITQVPNGAVVVATLARGTVEVGGPPPALGLRNSFTLMQDLFADLSRGTGTQVIAAAAGNSYAYEQRELKNGVFTHCVLDYLGQHPAGGVRVSELRSYLAAEVARLTWGAQRPTARAGGEEFDWEVW